ncbi:hypothetical protein BDV97DRAFT_363378 [Delphinella strobiligena]|nr:hypothetical protein BDV97DRAFT_363378 [Delphinella strobiligena]
MPKKHKQSYLNAKPNYVHPSLGGGKQATAGPSTSSLTSTVNWRLSQLRIAQASPASDARKRELAELSTQKSLPPSLGQGILGFAPTAPPRLRPSTRSRIRLRGTPGPAPPPSWQTRATRPLQQIDESRYRRAGPVARGFGKSTSNVERHRPDELARFLKMIGDDHVREGSLVHIALRTAAQNWEAISEDCLEDLDYLPVHLRTVLLSYLITYGPPEGVNMTSVQALFRGETDATCLDLSGLVGWNMSMKRLKRWLSMPFQTSSLLEGTPTDTDVVADSWEEIEADEVYAPLTPALSTRAHCLTRLSLAYPGPLISWTDLLSLSKEMGTLTHLSLAHWPIPTRTPNMKTASYISNLGTDHAASPTSLYSASDKDFQEPIIVLRQLSENTYCLRWLDLHACSTWLPSLTWQGESTPTAPPTPSDWDHQTTSPLETTQGPDWRGSWRNIAYLNTSQDWVPRARHFLTSAAFKGRMHQHFYPLNRTHLQILQDLRDSAPPSQEDKASVPLPPSHCPVCGRPRTGKGDQDCGVCTAYYDHETARVARWLEREAEAWAVGLSVNLARAAGSGGAPRCTFDHGWQRRDVYSLFTETRV